MSDLSSATAEICDAGRSGIKVELFHGAGSQRMQLALLSGRFVASNWSVDDLMARAQEIDFKDLLKIKLNAELGGQQFDN